MFALFITSFSTFEIFNSFWNLDIHIHLYKIINHMYSVQSFTLKIKWFFKNLKFLWKSKMALTENETNVREVLKNFVI